MQINYLVCFLHLINIQKMLVLIISETTALIIIVVL